jgi:hypothetical protein
VELDLLDPDGDVRDHADAAEDCGLLPDTIR